MIPPSFSAGCEGSESILSFGVVSTKWGEKGREERFGLVLEIPHPRVRGWARYRVVARDKEGCSAQPYPIKL